MTPDHGPLIEVSRTPNPNAMKFTLDRVLLATGSRSYSSRFEGLDDPLAVAIFEMTNGAVYTYRGSWCAEGLSTSWECDWRLIGSRGSALWDGGDRFRAQQVVKNAGLTSARAASTCASSA